MVEVPVLPAPKKSIVPLNLPVGVAAGRHLATCGSDHAPEVGCDNASWHAWTRRAASWGWLSSKLKGGDDAGDGAARGDGAGGAASAAETLRWARASSSSTVGRACEPGAPIGGATSAVRTTKKMAAAADLAVMRAQAYHANVRRTPVDVLAGQLPRLRVRPEVVPASDELAPKTKAALFFFGYSPRGRRRTDVFGTARPKTTTTMPAARQGSGRPGRRTRRP